MGNRSRTVAIAVLSNVMFLWAQSGQGQEKQGGSSASVRPDKASSVAQGRRALEVLQQFDQIATPELWPGFTPLDIPVEVYDGTDTFLYHHPKPPEGFRQFEQVPGLFVFKGRHESVRANTSTDVNGIRTATAELSNARASSREMAALLVHESFHAYASNKHPKWAANEVSLFTYPVTDAEVLRDRRMETAALVRAMQAGTEDEAACLAHAALEQRLRRFNRMPAESAAYERGTELNEGLAQYIEYLSIQKPPALSAEDFPAEMFRHRGYATGQAYATLLDRFAPNWKAEIGDRPLDELLRDYLPVSSRSCTFSPQEIGLQQERAERDARQVVLDRKTRLSQFLNTPGWTVQIVAGKEPLSPQMFDPWNLASLENKEVLHTSLLKLGNNSGAVEIHEKSSLTQAAGQHPLFTGVSKVTIKGLKRPTVTKADGRVKLEATGLKAEFNGSAEQSGEIITITLQ